MSPGVCGVDLGRSTYKLKIQSEVPLGPSTGTLK